MTDPDGDGEYTATVLLGRHLSVQVRDRISKRLDAGQGRQDAEIDDGFGGRTPSATWTTATPRSK